MKSIIKNIANVAAVVTSALFLTACPKDKGNYDYSVRMDPNAVQIDFPGAVMYFSQWRYEYIVGEEVVITPKITVHDKTLKPENMKYTWYFNGEEVSNETVLRLNDIPIGQYTGGLTITDTRYGVIYHRGTDSSYGDFSLVITSEYTHGFAVLSSEGGVSKLGYIRQRDGVWEDFDSDIYPLTNGGEELGGEPVNIVHHAYTGNDGAVFATQLNQNGGIGPVDIDNNNEMPMQRIGLIEREFLGGYPSGLKVKDMIYKRNNVFLLSENGEVYTRPEITDGFLSIVPHGGRFPNVPMYMDGRITKWVNPKAIEAIMNEPELIIAYDGLNKRMVSINSITTRTSVMDQYRDGEHEPIKPGDPGTDGRTQNSLTFPSPGDLSGYDLVLLGSYLTNFDYFFSNANGNYNSVVAVLKGADNKYYCLMFDWYYEANYNEADGGRDIDLKKFFEFPVQNIDGNMKYAVYLAGKPYMFFTANGNRDLCFMNLATNQTKVVYSHGAPITTIQAGETDNTTAQLYAMLGMDVEYSAYHDKLAIGTEDGKVVVFDMANVDGSGQAEILKTYETPNGPIVDIEYLSFDWSQTTSVE